MRQSLFLMSIILAILLGFVGYCWLLLDLFQDVKLGRYEYNPFDTLVESVVIVAYCYVAFRFIQSRFKNIQTSYQTSTSTLPKASSLFTKLLHTSTRARLQSLRTRPHRFN